MYAAVSFGEKFATINRIFLSRKKYDSNVYMYRANDVTNGTENT